MDALKVTLRTKASEEFYQKDRAAGKTRPLRCVSAIKRWKYWRLIPNDYPYDVAYGTHHMLMPIRVGVADRTDLSLAEKREYELILRTYVYSNYDQIIENTPRTRSVTAIYHVHVVCYHPSRKDMQL